MTPRLRPCCALLFLALAAAAHAQTAQNQKVYVTRDFKAGLHEEKSVDSPITTLVSSGAALEVIKREDSLTFVRTPDGATGWIDNSYLVNEPPTDAAELKRMRERADALERRLNEANQRIAAMETSSAPAGTEAGASAALVKRNQELEQQLKSERLHAGELQVQVTELRKRLDLAGNESSLVERVEQLEAENRKLRLASPGGAPPMDEPATAAPMSPRRTAAFAILLLAVGIGGGMYLMDWLNRRRHGGFRI